MKPILGVDITEDKENEIINGNEFIAGLRKSSGQQLRAYQQS